MKNRILPSIKMVGDKAYLYVAGESLLGFQMVRAYELSDEGLANIRMQSGDALLLRARYQAQKQAKKEAAAVAEEV